MFLLLLTVVALNLSLVTPHYYGCCNLCRQTRNVTFLRTAAVTNTACPTVTVSEKRCVYKGWWGCQKYATVYKTVNALMLMEITDSRQETYCNTTCFHAHCYYG